MATDSPAPAERSDHDVDSALTERIRALERAVTDSDDPPSPVPAISTVASDLQSLTDRVAAVETSVADLEARQQAMEAYVDRVEHVNETVERRADAALAAVDRLESAVDASDRPTRQRHQARTESETPESQPGTPESGVSDPAPAGAPSHVSDAAGTSRDCPDGPPDSGADPTDERAGVLARLLGW